MEKHYFQPEIETMSQEEIRKIQSEKLVKQVKHVWDNVPCYRAKMEEKGVTQIAHFGPLYRFKIVEEMGYNPEEIAKTCPNCEEVFYKRFTHLPLYGLSDEQLEYMADAVLESVAEMQSGK